MQDALSRVSASCFMLLLLFEMFFNTLKLFLQLFPVLLKVFDSLLFGEELPPMMTWAAMSMLLVIGHTHCIPPSRNLY